MKKISITENDVTTLHMIWETPQEIENIWFRIQENKEQSASHPYYHDQEFNANDLPYQYLERAPDALAAIVHFLQTAPNKYKATLLHHLDPDLYFLNRYPEYKKAFIQEIYNAIQVAEIENTAVALAGTMKTEGYKEIIESRFLQHDNPERHWFYYRLANAHLTAGIELCIQKILSGSKTLPPMKSLMEALNYANTYFSTAEVREKTSILIQLIYEKKLIPLDEKKGTVKGKDYQWINYYIKLLSQFGDSRLINFAEVLYTNEWFEKPITLLLYRLKGKAYEDKLIKHMLTEHENFILPEIPYLDKKLVTDQLLQKILQAYSHAGLNSKKTAFLLWKTFQQTGRPDFIENHLHLVTDKTLASTFTTLITIKNKPVEDIIADFRLAGFFTDTADANLHQVVASAKEIQPEAFLGYIFDRMYATVHLHEWQYDGAYNPMPAHFAPLLERIARKCEGVLDGAICYTSMGNKANEHVIHVYFKHHAFSIGYESLWDWEGHEQIFFILNELFQISGTNKRLIEVPERIDEYVFSTPESIAYLESIYAIP
ncbi:hypothetical protein HNQ91_002399 [Filimonas zeae]|uniref:Uncharacterized protein n=1 Tax=Filimonas zeae TaxID=1737353 RepID=A0A917MU60_9BACT|nr:hypothetical protein [Filimonas zeae]MDR6339348.1 hypothetical protein [Filimonas zeae]GGH64004.1 hypothetical protein GCM10011379_15550 [Filimonas zeae]